MQDELTTFIDADGRRISLTEGALVISRRKGHNWITIRSISYGELDPHFSMRIAPSVNFLTGLAILGPVAGGAWVASRVYPDIVRVEWAISFAVTMMIGGLLLLVLGWKRCVFVIFRGSARLMISGRRDQADEIRAFALELSGRIESTR